MSSSPKVLRQCLSAYAQAEKDPSVKNLPDLHYNRAMAYKHMEEYKFAITGFHTALCLEPGTAVRHICSRARLKELPNWVVC